MHVHAHTHMHNTHAHAHTHTHTHTTTPSMHHSPTLCLPCRKKKKMSAPPLSATLPPGVERRTITSGDKPRPISVGAFTTWMTAEMNPTSQSIAVRTVGYVVLWRYTGVHKQGLVALLRCMHNTLEPLYKYLHSKLKDTPLMRTVSAVPTT